MKYGSVLSRAWEITWRWKALWILGFLVSLGSGFSTSGSPSYSSESSDWGRRYGWQMPVEWIGVLATVVCLGLLLAIAVWVISVMARGGLIAGVQQVEDEDSTTFLKAWRVGRSRFWTLFGISILAAIPTIIMVLLGVVALVLLITSTVGAFDVSDAAGGLGIAASVLCGGTLCCGAVILMIVLDQIRTYAERAAILEDLGWIDAFQRGWQVLKGNLGPTVILWLIFFVIGLAFGAVIVGGMMVIVAPLVAVVVRIRPGPWMIVPICLGGLLGALVLAVIGSIVETFRSATWTLAYRQLTGMAVQPAVEPAPEG
jgi:hypothetical protein